MIDYITMIVIAAIAIGVTVAVFRRIQNIGKMNKEIYHELVRRIEFEEMDSLRRHRFSSETDQLSISQEKKEAIQKGGPKTFYYIDKSQVEDLYLQIFQEPEPKRIEIRESKESRKGITGDLKVIKPRYEKGKAEETTKVYNPEKVPSIMFNKVEDRLLEDGKVAFGLEEFEFEKSSIDEFKSMCDQMQNKLNFDIPEDLQDKFISDKMKEFALQYTKKISASSGYVAIQTEFSIISIVDDIYTLSFVHPLNRYLPQESTKVRIQVICPEKHMTPSGHGTFKKDKSVKITCWGKVVSWNDKDKILEICPIAIY